MINQPSEGVKCSSGIYAPPPVTLITVVHINNKTPFAIIGVFLFVFSSLTSIYEVSLNTYLSYIILPRVNFVGFIFNHKLTFAYIFIGEDSPSFIFEHLHRKGWTGSTKQPFHKHFNWWCHSVQWFNWNFGAWTFYLSYFILLALSISNDTISFYYSDTKFFTLLPHVTDLHYANHINTLARPYS